MGDVIAGGNWLGTGPRLLKLDPAFLPFIRDRASRGENEYAQLELDMFRHSALYYIEHLGDDVVHQLARSLFPQVRSRAEAVRAGGGGIGNGVMKGPR